LNSLWVGERYKSAVACSGIVTLIAFYHYFRIFNSWNESYSIVCNYGQPAESLADAIPTGYTDTPSDGKCLAYFSGTPFNDAYRYMDWLLTVPLLLIELILVMSLDEETTFAYSLKLGFAAALMIILGYPGEISASHSTRWVFWVLAMIPFLYIVYALFVGLSDAVAKQPEAARSLVSNARYVTIISWLTYPIVYIIPMLGATGTSALVGVQIGYSISDFISKCGVGLMITKIALAKSKASGENAPLLDSAVQYRS